MNSQKLRNLVSKEGAGVNWKYIAIVGVLAAIVLAGILAYENFFSGEPEAPAVGEAPVVEPEAPVVEKNPEGSEGSGGSTIPPQAKMESCKKCHLPTFDGGKACTDSSQCESYCQAPGGTEIDTEIIGQCYGFEEAICMQEVRDGIADAEWCY